VASPLGKWRKDRADPFIPSHTVSELYSDKRLKLEASQSAARTGLNLTVKNSIWNALSFLASAGIMFLSLPLMLSMLGTEQYGVMVLLTAVLAPLGLTTLNLAQATVKYVAEAVGRGSIQEAARFVQTTLLFNIGTGLVGSAGLAAVAGVLVKHVFIISPENQIMSQNCLYWVAAGWTVMQVASTFLAVPTALQQYPLVASGTTLQALLSAGLGLSVLFAGGNLLSFMKAQFVVQVLAMLGWFVVAKRLLPDSSLLPRWHTRAFRTSFRYGSWQTIANVGSMMANQTDKYVLGALLPASAVGLYNIALAIEQRAYVFVYKLAEVLFPAFSDLQARNDRKREYLALMRASWLLTTLSASMLIPVLVWGREFLALWMGRQVADGSYRVLQVLALAGLLGSASNAGQFYLLGSGRTRWSAFIAWATGICVLVGSIILIPRLGLEGAGWSNVAAMVVQAGAVTIMWKTVFGSDSHWAAFVSALYGPIVVGLCVAGILRWAKSMLQLQIGWPQFIVGCGCSSLLVFLAILAADRYLPGGNIRAADISILRARFLGLSRYFRLAR
jgi:O-antigen/teichoic acid export membrane protein